MKESKSKIINFQFQVPEEFDMKFRTFLVRKYGAYKKGMFAKEIQLAITKLMNEYGEGQAN